MRVIYKSPITLWRLGLGPLIGVKIMILTTTGRKSGLPRHTAIEYNMHRGRKYVMAGWGGESDWYRNIRADPLVTIQTAGGVERVRARRVVDDAELADAYDFIEDSPVMQRWVELLGMDVDRDRFITEKERFFLVTFDLTDDPTPPPLEADLRWAWVPVGLMVALGWLAGRRVVTD
jgi:deazaflavin-dependent oxidoreductase (nitroreductase family)